MTGGGIRVNQEELADCGTVPDSVTQWFQSNPRGELITKYDRNNFPSSLNTPMKIPIKSDNKVMVWCSYYSTAKGGKLGIPTIILSKTGA